MDETRVEIDTMTRHQYQFRGWQCDASGRLAYALFNLTDPGRETTFAVRNGGNVAEALRDARERMNTERERISS